MSTTPDRPDQAIRPPREPKETLVGAGPGPTAPPPAHDHRARVDLPEWMRNPTPPRRTPGRLASELLDRLPVLGTARRSLWRWRDRTPDAQSRPVVAVVVFLATTALTIALVGWFFYWLYLSLNDMA
ncbi:hypothetical protein [Micromonospora sp. KLBMP9576]|uniref:hypothetical protein n=1 Tax=Micromonospora sp. KLBMP9576 TaxID=3424769 RepID=UPI003D8BCD0F